MSSRGTPPALGNVDGVAVAAGVASAPAAGVAAGATVAAGVAAVVGTGVATIAGVAVAAGVAVCAPAVPVMAITSTSAAANAMNRNVVRRESTNIVIVDFPS